MSSTDSTPLWSTPVPPEAPSGSPGPPPGDHEPPRRPPSGGRLAALLVGAAVLGAGIVAAILGAAGAIHTAGGTTTVVGSSAGAVVTSARGTTSIDPTALYARAAGGAVDITVSSGSSSSSGPGGPFQPPNQSSTALGSGAVIDGQGHILTAEHVVDGATSITVTFQDGTKRKAKLVGSDPSTDTAVIKVDPAGLTLHPLALGSAASLRVGDALAVIGDPFGYDRSLSTGLVSGLDRTISAPNGFTVAHAIQTDAALNPGNSGGPVLDASGDLVGIADQIATGTSGADSYTGVGFAVPIDAVKSGLSKLEQGKKISHAYLGVSTSEQSDGQGALVGSVQSGGPAAKAGLKTGDLVVAFNGKPVDSVNGLVAAIAAQQPGDQVTLTVQRGGARKQLTVTLGTQPTQAPSAG